MLEYYDKRDYRLLLFVFIGLLFFGIGAGVGLKNVQRVRTGVQGTGTVVGLNAHRGDSTTYAPIVEFMDASGTKHQFTSGTASNVGVPKVGSTVRVIYPAASPDDAEINGLTALWVLPLFFSSFGLLFAAIGLGVIIASSRYRGLAEKLRGNSIKVSAVVSGMRNGSTAINKQYSQIISARSAEGKMYETPPIRPDYATAFMIGGIVDIYVSPENPNAYLFEVPPKGTAIAMAPTPAVQEQPASAWTRPTDGLTPPAPPSLPKW